MVAVAAALGGTALSRPTATAVEPAAGPADPFFSYHRPARYDVTSTAVRVPVRDGSVIACRLYRPAAEGRFPGIVYEYTAYAGNAEEFGRGAAYFVSRGYNALVCQARGSGDSPGHLDPFSPQEQRDNYDVIEWFAAQPWSTGQIGQMGVSYGGHSSLLVAVNQPPHLEAIIPINGIHDWYANTIYRGGIYSARIRGWQQAVAPHTLRTYAEHPLYDDFWRGRSVMARWDRLTVPTLEINGWYDRYRDGMVKNFQARPGNVWLVSGPWEHGYPAGQPGDIGLGGYLAWWDHWLRDDPRAPLPRAKVTSYEIPEPGAGTGWRQFGQWPPADARTVRLSLGADATLTRGRTRPGIQYFDVNTDTEPAGAGERLRYQSRPLRRDVVLAGSITATVRASFTADDGAVAVVVEDVAPDGSAVRITAGWLKASHRAGHERLAPVEPGRVYTLPVHVWPTHYRLSAGHRLRVTISSDDYPEIDSTAPAGRVGVRVGAHGSAATITVLGNSSGLR
ncbi:hydrolase [Prauserella muralis]|uniref:Hydrolase n=1 Tax=Prauserella muralis TaxID=588067 RepID=A0A2V4AQV7_9PSEU|nr:hydrolase [Prauserella muralis]